MIKIIQVHFGVAQEKKLLLHISAHGLVWNLANQMSVVPRVTAVVSNGPVLRLSDETQANRSGKKKHKADYLNLEK